MSARKANYQWSAGEVAVASFTLAYMVVSLIAALSLENPEFAFYLVVMSVLIVVAVFVHLKTGLHSGALWGLSIWGLAHMAGGLMPVPHRWPVNGDAFVLYNLWLVPGILKYDQLVHAFGFGLITWISWQMIQKTFNSRGVNADPTIGLMVLCIASGMGFGAANEIVEFFATITLPSTNVGGYENTGWDLVANFVGCMLAALLILVFHSRRTFATS